MRDDIVNKVKISLEASDYDAIIVFGSDNIQYLSGAYLPFIYSFPDRYMAVLWKSGGDPVCICPIEWESSFRNLSWMENTYQYLEKPGSPEAIIEVITCSVKATVKKTGKIGMDMDRISYSLFNSMEKALDDFELVSCDAWLRELRMIKTQHELELLNDVAYKTDHGIMGATHHVLLTRTITEMDLSEDIRIHCMERELDVVGHHSVSQTASGGHARKFWPLAPKFGLGYHKTLKPGEYVRMEMRASHNGYWSNASRLMTMGNPTEEQVLAFEALVALRKVALKHMKPGTKCKEVYTRVKKEANKRGVELIHELGIGHSIGILTHEPPFMNESDDTELKPGMVLVLDPVIYGPEGEILRSKDTVVLTQNGCRVIGWYKDWREVYVAN